MNNSIGYKVLCCLSMEKQFALALLASVMCQATQLSPSPPRSQDPWKQCPPKSVSALKEGSTLPHRPLVSPYVFRAMDTIFSSHVILVSLRMLYHTIPAGRTSSLRQKRYGMVSTRLWM